MRISFTPRFIKQYAALSEGDKKACDPSVGGLAVGFGRAHKHAGPGLRKLRCGVCRASERVRIGFTLHGDILLLQTVGNHETMRSWLKGV